MMKLKLPGEEATLISNLTEGYSQLFEFKGRQFTFTLEKFDKQTLTVSLKED
jgi:hypothetical protein